MIEKAKEDIRKFNEKSRQEALWLHLVSAIDFWKKTLLPILKKPIFSSKKPSIQVLN
jgi:hypothetical protein